MYNVLLVHVVLKVAPIVGKTIIHIETSAETRMKVFNITSMWISSTPVDSLWLKDTIWRQGPQSALTQIVVCCLMAPICCLSWCWLEANIYTAFQFYRKYKKHILLSLLSPIAITITITITIIITIIIIIIIVIIIITNVNITVIINLLTYSILIFVFFILVTYVFKASHLDNFDVWCNLFVILESSNYRLLFNYEAPYLTSSSSTDLT